MYLCMFTATVITVYNHDKQKNNSYHVSDLFYPARWYPPGTISNHSYTHCNLVVHPLDPPTMWVITNYPLMIGLVAMHIVYQQPRN